MGAKPASEANKIGPSPAARCQNTNVDKSKSTSARQLHTSLANSAAHPLTARGFPMVTRDQPSFLPAKAKGGETIAGICAAYRRKRMLVIAPPCKD